MLQSEIVWLKWHIELPEYIALEDPVKGPNYSDRLGGA